MRRLERQMIIASAGSGKTYTMSCRYIRLLTLGESVRQVFASTFTRKAAGEILDRVLTMLADAAADAGTCVELARNAEVEGLLTPERAAELLAGLAREMHTLNVGTLDSFFARTARAFAYELGLPPGWTIASEPVDVQLRTEAIHRMLRDDDPQPLVDLMRRIHLGDAGRSVHQTLLDLVTELHAVYRETCSDAAAGDPWDWMRPMPDPRRVLSDEELQRVIEDVARFPVPKTKAGTPSKDWEKALASAADLARRKEWEEFVSKGLAAKVAAGETDYARHPIPDDLAALIGKLLDYAKAVKLHALCVKTIAAKELVERFDAEYQAMKRARRAYRFEDVTAMLADASLSLDTRLAELYYRLDGRITHLLLDEFQDTSLMQWRALSPIAEEVMQSDGDRMTLIVADPKQSIYAWRGGEPLLLPEIMRKHHLDEEPLVKSWRSSPVIIEAVNSLFGGLASNAAFDKYSEAAAAWALLFRAHGTEKTDLPGYVELRNAPARDDDKPWAATIRHAAELVRDLHRDAPDCSIGVLMRTNNGVRRVIYELRELGVTCSEEGGNPLTDSVAVTAVLSLLAMADHPDDTAARFHVVSTPLGEVVGFTDHTNDERARELAHDTRLKLLVDGYGPTLNDWARDLAPSCSKAELKRLMQLVELGCRYDAEATMRPGDFVRIVESTRVEDPVAANVRAMTVHASKGLEFDIVVLAELDKRMVNAGSPSPQAMVHYRDPADPTGPITRVFPRVNKEVRALSDECEAIMRQVEARQMRDSLGFLYVAVTRARHALHMVLQPERGRVGKPTFADVLTAGLAPDKPRDPAGATLWDIGERGWHKSLRREVAPEELMVEPEPVLATGARRARGLGRTSPSQREGGKLVDVSKRLRLDATEAMAYGTDVHELMQRVAWADDAATAQLAASHAIVQRVLSHAAVRAALSRAAYPAEATAEVHNEQPFAVRDGDAVLTGVIDRLVLVRDADTGRVVVADVLDYKTDKEIDVDHYRPQLDAYRDVVARLYGLDADAVTAKLVYVSVGEVHEV